MFVSCKKKAEQIRKFENMGGCHLRSCFEKRKEGNLSLVFVSDLSYEKSFQKANLCLSYYIT